MFHFFLLHMRAHPLRSISLSLIACICTSVIIILVCLYANSMRALGYYSYNIIDERRVTISSDTNYFDMFSRHASGLPLTLQGDLERDSHIARVQAFSLVELPVLARFSLFEFALETDIPVFSVTDSTLTGAGVPIGISRAMIDFYNARVAGTSAMFPQIPELLLRGQAVRLTFGASKIFPPSPRIASPIDGQIVSIDENYPGFGLTLPESIVRSKMSEIGYTLAPPYKIVIMMYEREERAYIEEKYGSYKLGFDADAMRDLQKKQNILGAIFLSIAMFFSGVLLIFFVLLILSFFRERRDVFRVISIFGLRGMRARVLTLAEPLFLIFSGTSISLMATYFTLDWLTNTGTQALQNHGIFFTVFPLPITTIAVICNGVSVLFIGIVVILEYVWRRKSILR